MGNTHIHSKITDASLCKPIEYVNIQIINSESKIIKSLKSNKHGIWECDKNKKIDHIVFEKEGYVSKKISYNENFPSIIRMLENNLIGYQNKLWFNPGEKVSAYIHSPKEFNARLIRHGFNSTELQNIGSYPAIIQDVPNGFFVAEGLNWKEAFSYLIPGDVESGLYSLNLRDKDEIDYSITFVIQPNKDRKPQNKKILVLASTNNWQTYNIWGGRSRYRNFENPKTAQIINNFKTLGLRFVPEKIKSLTKNVLKKHTVVTIKDHPNAFQFRPLSLQRPHPNCSINDEMVTDKFTSHLALGEWRILSWLEREGFEYDLVSGYELHNNPSLLNNYNVFILSTHCEYWSKEMFSGLKTYYNNGGSVLNLSGNSIYREVEFLAEGSLRCTSLRFADSAEDESQIIGVRFDMRGYGSCAPFEVIEDNHWVFEGTNLKKGDLFARNSLNHYSHNNNRSFNVDPASSPGMAPLTGDGGSGWETDKITPEAPADITLIAKGTNKKWGGADMIIREPNGKGIMFSASSITFGGTLLIDDVSSRIVKNVITKAIERSNKD